ALVYDSGPGDGQTRSMVDATIVPALLAEGIAELGLLVVSHADLDHAGGAGRLRQRYPGAAAWMQSREPRPGWQACDAQRRAPPGWSLQVLHPSPGLPYLGNDSSCVLSVTGKGGAVLLPGDIGRAAELRLVSEGLGAHGIVVVPHHGSRSSSTAAFVQANDARLALSAAGAGNRFGFPHQEAVMRWQDAGATHWSTSGCGGLRVDLAADGTISAVSARRVRTAPWRWPAEPGCPAPGTLLAGPEHANGASGMIPHRLRSME
ncbi:MAG: MBL fold metallo-hydrolase, partial [Xanthomonadales bacterium]|nr:MBL fold metallo-hydrolase [Xanthomonadales bacterium]